MTTDFTKHDAGKLQPTLIPPLAIKNITRAMMVGAAKYERDGYLACTDLNRYRDALMRHWLEYLADPRSVDEESGLSHLAHVGANVAILIALEAMSG